MERRPYGIAVTLSSTLVEAESKTREALAAEGFGVLTEIDVKATLKAKLDIDRAPYKILGACNPTLANRALEISDDIGLLLPCNVIVFERDGTTVVAALDPGVMEKLEPSPGLAPIAREARERLERALASLEAS